MSRFVFYKIQSQHSSAFLIQQAAPVKVNVKKPSNPPKIIAPKTLVAAKVIAKRTIEAKIVPSAPKITRIKGNFLQESAQH